MIQDLFLPGRAQDSGRQWEKDVVGCCVVRPQIASKGAQRDGEPRERDRELAGRLPIAQRQTIETITCCLASLSWLDICQ